MTFEGEFSPPGIGATTVPFPIAGKGSCTFDDTALQLQGFAPARGAVLLALLGALAGVGGALAVKFLLLPGMSVQTIAIVGTTAFITGLAAPIAGRKTKPVTHSIPWERITKVCADPRQKGVAMVTVKKHKPKGAIHFRPADLDTFMSEVANRAGVIVK